MDSLTTEDEIEATMTCFNETINSCVTLLIDNENDDVL